MRSRSNAAAHDPHSCESISISRSPKTRSFFWHWLDVQELTDEAIKYLVAEYAELRQKSDNRTLPITARLLETMIRLSTAHAKLRLSAKVELSDCK